MTATPGFLPLEKLLQVPPGRKHVTISADLLPNLDFTSLRKSIHFGFDHSYKVNICVTPDTRAGRFYVQMDMSPDYSDWPQPNEAYRQLYCAALGVAAQQASFKDELGRFRCHRVIIRSDHIIMTYDSLDLTNGVELVAILRRKLDMTRDEMPSVIEVLAKGPIPGTTPDEDED